MSPLRDQFETLRHWLRWWSISRGLACTGLTFCGLLLLIGLCDWGLRSDLPLWRWFSSGLVAGSVSLVCLLMLGRPLFSSLTDLDVALRIERVDPRWEGMLAAFASLSRSAPVAGSPQADFHVLSDLEQELTRRRQQFPEALEPDHLLDRRALDRPWRWAIGGFFLLSVVVLVYPLQASTAGHRLFAPWASIPWPKETQLAVLDENWQPVSSTEPWEVVARLPLQVIIRDQQGRPPQELTLHLQRGSERRVESLSPVQVAGPKGELVDLFQWTVIPDQRPLYFRAVAGDDQSLPWYTIIGRAPPRIVSASTTFTPPAYTGRPTETVQGIPARWSGWAGTQVSIRGEADRPLKTVMLHSTSPDGSAKPIKVEGTRFSAELTVPAQGRLDFQFRLTDEGGLSDPHPTQHELLAVEDRRPEAHFHQPASDLLVTPRAVVPIEVGAADDVGLARIAVAWELVPATTPGTVEDAETHSGDWLVWETAARDELAATLTGVLSLPDLGIGAGSRLLLRTRVSDHADRTEREQWSNTRTLTVVSPAELQRDMQARQAALAEFLESWLARQLQIKQMLRQLLIQQQQTGQLRRQDLDTLSVVSERQRQLLRDWEHPDRGPDRQTAELSQSHQINRLEDQDTRDLLVRLIEELERLQNGPLAKTRASLQLALKRLGTSESALPSSGLEFPELPQMDQGVTELVEALTQLTSILRASGQRGHLLDELQNLSAEMQDLQQETAAWGQRTLAASVAALEPQERAELAKLGERLRNLSMAVERLSRALQLAAAEQPQFLEAAQLLDESQLSLKLIEAAAHVERNNLGVAVTVQAQIAAVLSQLENLLLGSRSHAPEALLKRLDQAESAVRGFRSRIWEWERTWRQASQSANNQNDSQPLEIIRTQQAEMTTEMLQLSRDLRWSGLDRPAQPLDEAARQLRSFDEATQREGRSTTSSEPPNGWNNADRELERSLSALAESRRQLEKEAAADRLHELSKSLEHMSQEQRELADEVQRLDAARVQQGRWSRSDLSTLQRLAIQQETLSTEVSNSSQTIDSGSLLQDTLAGLAEEMRDIASRLKQRETNDSIPRRQYALAQQLMVVVEATRESLEPVLDSRAMDNSGEASADGDSHSLVMVTDIHLLIRQQRDLRAEGESLIESQVKEEDQPGRDARIRALGERQRQLTGWYRRLLPELFSKDQFPLAPTIPESPRNENRSPQPESATP